ncbi:MAG: YcaO-like family protein [Spirochaetota bacterium]
MKISKVLKNSNYFKCDTPDHTVQKIEKGLRNLGLEFKYTESRFSRLKYLYWAILEIPSLNYFVEGKGITQELARASAYAEMVERISSGFAIKYDFIKKFDFSKTLPELINYSNFDYLEGYTRASQKDIKNPLAIESLFRNKEELSGKDIEKIKESDLAQHWVDGYSLIEEKRIKVPIKLIGKISSTNGLAAGNTIEEAIVQASNEIFERYTSIETIKYKKIIPTIDLKTINDDRINEIIDFFHGNKIKIMVKDFSSNGLFPSYGILFKNENVSNDKNPIKRAYKYRSFRVASSFNTEEAILRCFSEKIQSKTLDMLKKEKYLDIIWYDFLRYFESEYRPFVFYHNIIRKYEYAGDLQFLEAGEVKDYKPEYLLDCSGEIERIKGICQRLRTDLIMINHTHPAIDFPVVRIIIPGLSDILSYSRIYNSSSLADTIINPSRAERDFEVPDEDFIYKSDWLKKNETILQLAGYLINYIKAYNNHYLYTFGVFNRRIDSIKLLAVLFYKVGDLESFNICANMLSSMYPHMKKNYKYLQLLAVREKKEKLFDELKKLNWLESSVLDNPEVNIIAPHYDGSFRDDFEKNYISDLKKLISSFYT